MCFFVLSVACFISFSPLAPSFSRFSRVSARMPLTTRWGDGQDPATQKVWDPKALKREGMPLRFVNNRRLCAITYKLCRFDDIDVPRPTPVTAASCGIGAPSVRLSMESSSFTGVGGLGETYSSELVEAQRGQLDPISEGGDSSDEEAGTAAGRSFQPCVYRPHAIQFNQLACAHVAFCVTILFASACPSQCDTCVFSASLGTITRSGCLRTPPSKSSCGPGRRRGSKRRPGCTTCGCPRGGDGLGPSTSSAPQWCPRGAGEAAPHPRSPGPSPTRTTARPSGATPPCGSTGHAAAAGFSRLRILHGALFLVKVAVVGDYGEDVDVDSRGWLRSLRSIRSGVSLRHVLPLS